MEILKLLNKRFFFNKISHEFQQYMAFTLAEVLITLGIIGVVASLTIPTLIQKQQEIATATALKKAYSTLSQAYNLTVQDNGTPDNWNLVALNDVDGAVEMINKVAPYLKSIKNCGKQGGCWPNFMYKNLDNSDWGNISLPGTNVATAQLADGSLLMSWSAGNCAHYYGSSMALNKVCGQYFIDVNGSKLPNKQGFDVFVFDLTLYGITPAGTASETSDIFSGCLDRTNGHGCTAWVIYNENLDYLHCSDLAWDGKHKCS